MTIVYRTVHGLDLQKINRQVSKNVVNLTQSVAEARMMIDRIHKPAKAFVATLSKLSAAKSRIAYLDKAAKTHERRRSCIFGEGLISEISRHD